MPGWGRKAAGRIDKTQFGGDELLKSLEGKVKLDAQYTDYDQWSRTGAAQLLQKHRSGRQTSSPTKDRPELESVPAVLNATDMVGGEVSASTLGHPYCSTGCRHPWNKKVVNNDDEVRRAHQREVDVLQLLIRTRKKALQEYKRREKQLLEINMELKMNIQGNESNVHKDVKGLLRKYERFRGAVSTLNSQFENEKELAMGLLGDTEETVNMDLQALEKEVQKMDSKLKAKQDELRVLRSYKDKDYPVRALRIADLQKQIESLSLENKDEKVELERILSIEKDKFVTQDQETEHKIKSSISESAISLMHDSLKDMALQNLMMKKEIEMHKVENEKLEDNNRQLEKEVKELLESPAELDVRKQMFPRLFPSETKCTPDMDVVLDIPVHEWLPI